MIRRLRPCGVVVLGLCLASACAGRRLTLPTGPATPFPEFPSAYQQATAECRGVRSMVASLSLSGRTRGNRLAGRIDTGLAEPSRIRLELFPPMSFGRAAFVLVAKDENATLLLPRDNRVLRDAQPEEIVEALAGVPLGGAELRAVLSGCGLDAGTPAEGRRYENGWVAAEADGTTVYLRELNGRWRVAGASRGPVSVQYGSYDAASGRPETVNFRTIETETTPETNLTVKLSDVEINQPLGDEVFEVEVPTDAVPLTLEELKRGIEKGDAPSVASAFRRKKSGRLLAHPPEGGGHGQASE